MASVLIRLRFISNKYTIRCYDGVKETQSNHKIGLCACELRKHEEVLPQYVAFLCISCKVVGSWKKVFFLRWFMNASSTCSYIFRG